MADENKRERRRKVREIAEVLKSDLYKRGKSFDGEDSDQSATWWSPLKHSVTYGYDSDERVWIRCRHADGELYAQTDDGDAYWLDEEML